MGRKREGNKEAGNSTDDNSIEKYNDAQLRREIRNVLSLETKRGMRKFKGKYQASRIARITIANQNDLHINCILYYVPLMQTKRNDQPT